MIHEIEVVIANQNPGQNFHQRLLWEFERTDGEKKCIGWLTLYHVINTQLSGHSHSDPKLVVKFTDLMVPKEQRKPGSWIHDITNTPLGHWVIKAWTALYPDDHAALPTTHDEWLAWRHKLAMEDRDTSLPDAELDS